MIINLKVKIFVIFLKNIINIIQRNKYVEMFNYDSKFLIHYFDAMLNVSLMISNIPINVLNDYVISSCILNYDFKIL